MKLEAHLIDDETMIKIAYDDAARVSFAYAAKVATAKLNERSVRRMLKAHHAETEKTLSTGTTLMEFLAYEPTNPKPLTTDQAFAMFVTMSFVGCHLKQGPPEPVAEALELIARITPIPVVLPMSVPPAAEIFDSYSVGREVWDLYEKIRLWRKPQNPYAFIADLQVLRIELRRITRPGPGIEAFIKHLDFLTDMYRATLSYLGAADASLA
jgi:hypothetical protein